MIHSVGIDLIEIDRIRRIRTRHPRRFDAHVYTPSELEYCATRADPDASLAARFAVKEALMKVLGTGWGEGVRWRDIEVCADARGAPRIVLHGAARARAEHMGIERVHISISHSRGHAVALALAEGSGGR